MYMYTSNCYDKYPFLYMYMHARNIHISGINVLMVHYDVPETSSEEDDMETDRYVLLILRWATALMAFSVRFRV